MIKMLVSEKKKPDLSSLYKNKETAILLRLSIVLVHEEVAIFFTTFTRFARIENRLNFPRKTSAARILGTRNQCSAMEAMIINCKWGKLLQFEEDEVKKVKYHSICHKRHISLYYSVAAR